MKQLKIIFENKNYNLGLVDELFAVFVGATLVLSFSGWTSKYLTIAIAIVVSVILVSAFAVVAANAISIKKRYINYLYIIILTIISIFWVTSVANYDISITVSDELRALPIGVLVWILVREISIVIMNISKINTYNKTLEEEQVTHRHYGSFKY